MSARSTWVLLRAAVSALLLAGVPLGSDTYAGAPTPDESVRIVGEHGGSVMSVAFSPDGATLASSSRDKSIKLWDLRPGNLQRTLNEHAADVYCVVFSPSGNLLLSAS